MISAVDNCTQRWEFKAASWSHEKEGKKMLHCSAPLTPRHQLAAREKSIIFIHIAFQCHYLMLKLRFKPYFFWYQEKSASL